MKTRLMRLLPAKALAFDVSVLFGGFGLQLLTQIAWLLLALRLRVNAGTLSGTFVLEGVL